MIVNTKSAHGWRFCGQPSQFQKWRLLSATAYEHCIDTIYYLKCLICTDLAPVYPVLVGGPGECEHHVVVHLAQLPVLVLVHQLLDEVRSERDQESLKWIKWRNVRNKDIRRENGHGMQTKFYWKFPAQCHVLKVRSKLSNRRNVDIQSGFWCPLSGLDITARQMLVGKYKWSLQLSVSQFWHQCMWNIVFTIFREGPNYGLLIVKSVYISFDFYIDKCPNFTSSHRPTVFIGQFLLFKCELLSVFLARRGNIVKIVKH